MPKKSLFKKVFSIIKNILLRFYVLGIVVLICTIIVLFYSGYFKKLKIDLVDFLSQTSINLGLSVKNIYLEGQKNTQIQKITDIANINLNKPIIFVPTDEIRNQIEKISTVNYAVVERILPSTLNIRIIEKVPFALWQNNNIIQLIDIDGKVIKVTNLEKYKQLPIIIGPSAPSHIDELFNIIYKDLKKLPPISSVTHINDRRWNIKFKNGTLIKLPEKNIDISWNQLIEYNKKNKILYGNAEYIDIRNPEKIYIKNR